MYKKGRNTGREPRQIGSSGITKISKTLRYPNRIINYPIMVISKRDHRLLNKDGINVVTKYRFGKPPKDGNETSCYRDPLTPIAKRPWQPSVEQPEPQNMKEPSLCSKRDHAGGPTENTAKQEIRCLYDAPRKCSLRKGKNRYLTDFAKIRDNFYEPTVPLRNGGSSDNYL